MNDSKRHALMAGLPSDRRLFEMSRDAKQRLIGTLIARTLDAIEEEQRAPDQWQSLDLKSALATLEAGMYVAAMAFVERALAGPASRGPPAGALGGHGGNAGPSIHDLRAQLALTQRALR
jgi:hypothetical protein